MLVHRESVQNAVEAMEEVERTHRMTDAKWPTCDMCGGQLSCSVYHDIENIVDALHSISCVHCGWELFYTEDFIRRT